LEVANPSDFGGKILTKKTREKMSREQEKVYNAQQAQQSAGPDGKGNTRDEKGLIIFTKPERTLMGRLIKSQQDGLIQYSVVPQFRIQYGGTEYPIDFAIPNLKIGIEADGEIFHSSPKQITHDKERDMKLAQSGWTILRFQDNEIEKQLSKVMSTIVKAIMQKEMALKNTKENLK
jgi:very-short-patch-repair endonuclease